MNQVPPVNTPTSSRPSPFQSADTGVLPGDRRAMAERLGLRGTPLIYTDSGEKIPGYREATVLAGMVKESTPLAN